MRRIALIPSAYPPSVGGVEEMCRHLALALSASGDAVEVWTQQPDGIHHPTSSVQDGLVIRRFPFPLPSSNPSSLPTAAVRGSATVLSLLRAVRAFRPQLLHVHCFGPNGAYATAASALTRTPLAVTLHGETFMDDTDIFEHSTTLRTALRIALRRARIVTACSQFTLDDAIARFGLPPEKGNVIFNGVDLEPAVVPSDRLPPAGTYLLAVGRLVERKGFDLLLEAFALLAPRQPDIRLVIAGRGPEEAALAELACSLGVAGRVALVGRLSREEVAAAMNGAIALVVPSRVEAFGLVILEAWTAGRCPIVTSHGGTAELVEHGRTGLIVDPLDTTALAATLERILTDEPLRARLGDAGRRRVTTLSWPTVADHYRRVYDRAAPDR